MRRWRPGALRPLIAAGLVAFGVLLIPLGIPVLPPPLMAPYLRTLGVAPESETGQPMPLPQDYADMLGWREMAEAMARVYQALPEDEQHQAVLFGASYGHAGALDYYGADLGLPPAVSTSATTSGSLRRMMVP